MMLKARERKRESAQLNSCTYKRTEAYTVHSSHVGNRVYISTRTGNMEQQQQQTQQRSLWLWATGANPTNIQGGVENFCIYTRPSIKKKWASWRSCSFLLSRSKSFPVIIIRKICMGIDACPIMRTCPLYRLLLLTIDADRYLLLSLSSLPSKRWGIDTHSTTSWASPSLLSLSFADRSRWVTRSVNQITRRAAAAAQLFSASASSSSHHGAFPL